MPVLRLVILAILVANIRGTILASRWKQMPEMQDPDLAPMRFNETWRDKLCDQLPPKLWPWARIPFFIITALYLLLEVAGLIVLYHHQHTGAAVR